MRTALLLLLLAACEPAIDRADGGLTDASDSRCPLGIVTGQDCDFNRLECPARDQICRCQANVWRCTDI